MPQQLEQCVDALIAKGKSKESAYAICNSTMGGSITETIEKDGDLYLKAFLLDSSINKNAWGVMSDTLDNNIRSFIGKPYVVQEDFQHPESGDTYDHHLQYQEQFRIGNIEDVLNKAGSYSALIKVTDPHAREAIRLGKFPNYVSPQLWHEEEGTTPQDQMRKWKGTHLAAVVEPAFGAVKARLIEQCNGNADVCLAQLKKASCNFCIKKTIDNYSKQKIVTNHIKPAVSSQGNLRIKSSNKMSVETPSTQNTEELEKLKQEIATKDAKIASLEQVNNKLQDENKTVSASLESLKGEYRKDKVSSLLSSVFYKTDQERGEAIESFTKSGMTYEEIDKHVAPLRATKSASVSSDSKLNVKSAASIEEETSSSNTPDWLLSFNHSVGATN